MRKLIPSSKAKKKLKHTKHILYMLAILVVMAFAIPPFFNIGIIKTSISTKTKPTPTNFILPTLTPDPERVKTQTKLMSYSEYVFSRHINNRQRLTYDVPVEFFVEAGGGITKGDGQKGTYFELYFDRHIPSVYEYVEGMDMGEFEYQNKLLTLESERFTTTLTDEYIRVIDGNKELLDGKKIYRKKGYEGYYYAESQPTSLNPGNIALLMPIFLEGEFPNRSYIKIDYKIDTSKLSEKQAQTLLQISDRIVMSLRNSP